METTLLQTKLYIPQPRPELVARPRLIERLNEGLHRKLTLVCAPAGSGKTTLLSDWAAQSDVSIGWVSLDESDNDLVRFFAYVIAALRGLMPEIGQEAAMLLQDPQPPPVEVISTTLINEISAVTQGSFPDPRPSLAKDTRRKYVLVLDDYHLIEIQAIHDALTFLLNHLPPRLHLIIASRDDPPLSLARLRIRADLIELRSTDLALRPDEAIIFFNNVIGLDISKEQVAALDSRTEGWIAGLQVAGLSMQGRDPEHISHFIKAFTGSHRYLLDYLDEEVLQKQAQATQDFLLQTSILNRISGPLCDAICSTGTAVTGQGDGQATLEQLEAANLFIIPLDDERHWYRYHHLFAEFLRNRLQQSTADVSQLHCRASRWYQQAGLMVEAIHHALLANEFEQAAEMVETQAQTLLLRREFTDLWIWLDTLPGELVRARSKLAIYYAWKLFYVGQGDEAELYLQHAEAALGHVGSKAGREADGQHQRSELQGHIVTLRAWLARDQGDLPQAIELSQLALDYLSDAEDTVFLQVRAQLNLAMAYYLTDDLDAAQRVLTEIMATGQAGDVIGETLGAGYFITHIQMLRGQFRQARQDCEQALALTTQLGWQTSPAAGFAYMSQGELLREQNKLEKAAHHLTQGIELARRGAYPYILLLSYVSLARVRQAQGDAAGALEAIALAAQIVERHKIGRFWPMPPVPAYRARLWLAQGNVEAAIDWAQGSGLDLDLSNGFGQSSLYEVDYLTLARILLAQNNPAQALNLLDHLQGIAQTKQRNGTLIEILILQALAQQTQHQTSTALTTLAKALAMAEPEGYIRIFIDEGQAMAELLHQAASQGIAPTYISHLLVEFPDSRSTDPGVAAVLAQIPKTQVQLIEPLSERELEVLQQVAEGLSNREIAAKLLVTQGTVKTHLRNIFGKLEVSNRTQAVARARSLNLL